MKPIKAAKNAWPPISCHSGIESSMIVLKYFIDDLFISFLGTSPHWFFFLLLTGEDDLLRSG